MKFIGSARRSLDLCVFVFTSAEMRDLVLLLQERGVIVRLITDREQEDASGSAVGTFREKGEIVTGCSFLCLWNGLWKCQIAKH